MLPGCNLLRALTADLKKLHPCSVPKHPSQLHLIKSLTFFAFTLLVFCVDCTDKTLCKLRVRHFIFGAVNRQVSHCAKTDGF